MHNLKEIRKNLINFKRKINERNTKIDFEFLLNLDKRNREMIQIKESLEQEKKLLSKKKNEINFNKSKDLSIKIDEILIKQKKIQTDLNIILSNIPNTALEEVPKRV